MKFGTPIWLTRGSGDHTHPHPRREVKATYLGANRNQIRARLEEDDPKAATWVTDTGIKVGVNAKGECSWWTRCAMRARDEAS